MTGLTVLAAPGDQLPEDVGKAGPLGLLLILLLLIAVILLVRSMATHLKRVPRSFDADTDTDTDTVVVPDTPAELFAPPPSGAELLEALRRAPRAIEPPRERDDDGDRSARPDAPD